MSWVHSAALALLVGAAVVSAACGEPPDKEMQQAQGAIEAARAAGADQYAHTEFAAAEDSLKRAREAVDQRDYQSALNSALDSRERAQNAAKEATERKASARGDAERAIADLTAALTVTRAKLKAAENAHIAAKTLLKPRQTIADAEQALQKARAAFGKSDYLTVNGIAAPATARLITTARDLDAIMAIVGRRRR